MSPSTTFAEATAIQRLSSHTYAANFPDDWCIGSVPHGGYVTATFLRVAEEHFNGTLSSQNQPHTIALHLDFLRRTQAGAAHFTVQDTKLGRQASVVHITLLQGPDDNRREEVVGYLTNSNVHAEEGISSSTSYKLTPDTPPVDLSLLSQDKDKNWIWQPAMPYSSFRKATAKAEFYFPRAGLGLGNSADEWIRLATGERWTTASLGYVCDMWPMPAEALLHNENPYDVRSKDSKPLPAKFWYPTLLLNLDIKKALPAEGIEWLFVRVTSKQIKNGRMDIEIVILDEQGEIVALSHHVSLVLPAARNLATRSNGSKM
ncbi:thioesterase family protein [Phlyctema vagabunda]|uniref:Thioesterase family protein n=1 Tax=Phlyctema vagabunda TaxID=108571 RepID=A0ABR4P1V6_9HELO